MYFVYVLLSFKDKELYIGYTEDVPHRVGQHLLGEVQSTRNRLPLQLIYYEAYTDKRDAKGREKFLKGGSGHTYLKKQLNHFFNVHS